MPATAAVVLLTMFSAVCAFAAWKDSRPADPLRPRLAPWRGILIASGFAAILMIVHLVNLAGFKTGQY